MVGPKVTLSSYAEFMVGNMTAPEKAKILEIIGKMAQKPDDDALKQAWGAYFDAEYEVSYATKCRHLMQDQRLKYYENLLQHFSGLQRSAANSRWGKFPKSRKIFRRICQSLNAIILTFTTDEWDGNENVFMGPIVHL